MLADPQQQQQQQQSFDHLTAEQRKKWNHSAGSYSANLFSTGVSEPNTRQMIQAVRKFWNSKQGSALRVLDLASNCGNPAIPLAKAFPDADVLATDLAPATLEFLKQHAAAENVRNVRAQPADAQNLYEFQNNTFTVVTCSYGLMFMPEHQRALREVCRVLQPGGLFVAAVWGPLESMQFGQWFSEVVNTLLGDLAPPPSPFAPWRFGNSIELLQDLKAAGFSNAQCTPYQHHMTWPLQDLFQFQIGPNGQSRGVIEKLTTAGHQNVEAHAEQVMVDMLRQKGCLHGDQAKFDNTALLFTAIKQ